MGNDAAHPAKLRRVVLVGFIPLAALGLLRLFDVPIGQPFFLIYRYSPFVGPRALAAAVAGLVVAAGVYVFWRGLRSPGALPVSSLIGMALSYSAMVVWTVPAPPSYAEQHVFNFLSPSHEGAFVLEAGGVESIRDYGSRDFFHRLERSVDEMRGRRVISNPPGMTVAAVLTRRVVEASPALNRLVVELFDLSEITDPTLRLNMSGAMVLVVVLTLAWGASIVPAWQLARLCLPDGAAAVVSFACVFNPATVCFTPGKDPAQLLTVLYIALFWMRAYSGRRALWAYAAGALLVAALCVGLIHLWTFLAVAGGTLVHSMRSGDGLRSWLRRCAGPAGIGAIAMGSVLYLLLDWNVALIVARVARRYSEIQVPIITDPFYWTLIGLPMFLLFIGPLFYEQLLELRARWVDPAAALGGCILLGAAAVMTYTYFFGNNNETPRLWIPFVPLIVWPLALRRRAFREDSPSNRTLWVALLAIQAVVTLAHWSLMDVREAEWRLSTGRMWD